ncbi:MAG: S9 family peptidase [Pseudomonadota bacterium]
MRRSVGEPFLRARRRFEMFRSTRHATWEFTLRSTSFAAAVIAAFATAVAADARPMKNTDVFELEVAANPQISPDGRHVVYERRSNDIMTDRARPSIWIVDTGSQRNHRPLQSGRDGYSSPRWSPSGDRIAYVSGAEGGKPQLYARWMDTGQTALLTNLQEAPGNIAWSPDGEMIAFSMFVEDKSEPLAAPPATPEGAEWAPPVKVIEDVIYRADGAGYARSGFTHIFVVPAEGGTARQLTDGDYNHGGGLSWSADSSAIVFSANRSDDWQRNPVEAEIWRVDIASGEMTALTDRVGPDAAPEVSPNGELIAYLGFDDQGTSNHQLDVYVMNADGSNKRGLTDSFDRSIDNVAWDSNDSLIVQYDDRGRTYLARMTLDGARDALVRDVSGVSIGRPYTSGQFSTNDGGAIAYTSGRSDRPSDIAVKIGEAPAKRLTRLNDDILAQFDAAPAERFTWQSSAGGMEIEGWLVYPPDFDESETYPLLLEIHGGPHTAYGPHFSAEVQLFAAAGYVVLYANPRGSTSYGLDFALEIDKNYPSQDYDDLMSGVDAVIERGFIDEDQLFVTGGSGGGVLTAWIVGKTDRFAAAVVAKPVINWASFVLTSDFYPFFMNYWFEAAPWENPDEYWERSPLSLVGNVSTPTMLLTGEADYRTPISESEQYYQALQLRDIDTALVRIPDAPHFIAGRPSQLIAKVDNILAWFARYRDDDANAQEASAAAVD